MSKKFLIPTMVLLLSLTSCTETIVERYSSDYWKVININIPATSWNCYSDAYGKPYFEADIQAPEITNYVFTSGFVICYYVEGSTQMPLPYTRHYQNDKGEQWTTTLDYEYTPGYVHVFYTNSDFNYLAGEPGNMTLRMVIQW